MEYKINHNLAKSKGLSDTRISMIETFGSYLFHVLEHPRLYGKPEEIPVLVEKLEFVLQHLWGFEEDASKHRYQLAIRGCKCAELMDNNYGRSSGWFWVDPNCPFHKAID